MASISRSKTTQESIQADADKLLLASLSRNPSKPASSPTTSPSHSTTQANSSSIADRILRDSLTNARKVSGQTSSALIPDGLPPTYRTTNVDTAPPYSGSAPTVDLAKFRKLSLKRDTEQANAAAGRRSTDGLFKDACATDLLFLIDTTSSMTPYINAAKEQVKEIVADVKKAFFNESQVRIAVRKSMGKSTPRSALSHATS